jgi:hypothetical protein
MPSLRDSYDLKLPVFDSPICKLAVKLVISDFFDRFEEEKKFVDESNDSRQN